MHRSQATVEVLKKQPTLLVCPFIVVVILMVAGTMGIVTIARDVETDAETKREKSEAEIRLLTKEKAASEQMVANAQLADLDTALFTSVSLVSTAAELVRTMPHVRQVCSSPQCTRRIGGLVQTLS